MTRRCYLYAAILSQPFDLESQIGSKLTQFGKPSRFRFYADLPIRYVQHMRPERGLQTPMIVQPRKQA